MKTPALILALVVLAGCAGGPRQPFYFEPIPMQHFTPMQVPNMQTTQADSGGASAFWTGSGSQVQTVTGQTAMRCEYRYGGTVFYRLFSMGCPSNVQVQ